MSYLKWGLQSSPQHVTYGEILQLWQRADALGYDSAWLFDHFIPITGSREGPCFEGWTLLTALAAQTHRIHTGCLVTSVLYRNPAVLARMGATLDVISGGRLELGIGAGWFEEETHAYGMPFPTTPERLGQLDEALQVITSLWTQDYSDYSGHYFSLAHARCEPKPVQKPTPTIWVGGQGEKVTLRIVARRAGGWDTDMLPLDIYDRKQAALEKHCNDVGRQVSSVRKMIHFSATIASDEGAAKQRAGGLAQQWNVDADHLRGRVLMGTPTQAVEELVPYLQRGVEHFVLSVPAPYDMRMIELFINEVAPLVEEQYSRMNNPVI